MHKKRNITVIHKLSSEIVNIAVISFLITEISAVNIIKAANAFITASRFIIFIVKFIYLKIKISEENNKEKITGTIIPPYPTKTALIVSKLSIRQTTLNSENRFISSILTPDKSAKTACPNSCKTGYNTIATNNPESKRIKPLKIILNQFHR